MSDTTWIPIKSLRQQEVADHLHLGSVAILAYPARGDDAPIILRKGRGPNLIESWGKKFGQFYAVSTSQKEIEGRFLINCTDEPKKFEVIYQLEVELAELEGIKAQIVKRCDADLLRTIKNQATALIADAVGGHNSTQRDAAQRKATMAIMNLSGPGARERTFLDDMVRLVGATVTVMQDAKKIVHLENLDKQKYEKELIEQRRTVFHHIFPPTMPLSNVIVELLARDPSKINDVYADLKKDNIEISKRDEAMLVAILEAVKGKDDITGPEILELIRPLLPGAHAPPHQAPAHGQLPDKTDQGPNTSG